MRYFQDREAHGSRRRPWLYQYPFHVCLDTLYRTLGATGPGSLVATACTASTIAATQAYDAVREGRTPLALIGGVDPACEFSFAGFAAMQNVSSQACAPFSLPIGLTLGEASVFLVLENADHAAERGRQGYAEIRGYSLNADGYHPTAPDPSGAPQQRLLAEALSDAGLAVSDIDYINAHGTATASNDPMESQAIESVFGADVPPISSTKGATGHTLGAAGAVELAFTVLALRDQTLPPSANFTEARPDCTLDYIPNATRPAEVRAAISENFAFGGNNAALALSRPDVSPTTPPQREQATPVITGLGAISPVGVGMDAIREALAAGQSGIRAPEAIDMSGLPVQLAAALEGFKPSRISRTNLRRADRIGELTVCGCELALADAGLRVTKELTERIGLVSGTGRGPADSCEAFYRDVATDRPTDANPKIFPNTVLNAGSGLAAVNLRLKGPNVAVTVGAASGLHAISLAADLIRQGRADVVLAGGCDELNRSVLEGYATARVLSPFAGEEPEEGIAEDQARRNGMILGEGSAYVVIESEAFARARGAKPFARIVADASAGSPDLSGEAISRTMSACLEASPGGVDRILEGAIGLTGPDAKEGDAIAQLQSVNGAAETFLASRVFGVSSATPVLALCAALDQARRGDLSGRILANGLSEGGFAASVLLETESLEAEGSE